MLFRSRPDFPGRFSTPPPHPESGDLPPPRPFIYTPLFYMDRKIGGGNNYQWHPQHGPIAIIRPSDGCGGMPFLWRWTTGTIFHEFGCYLGSVGLMYGFFVLLGGLTSMASRKAIGVACDVTGT